MRALATLAALVLLLPAASAHERYASPDDRFTIIIGEQSEPVYTYDWTNLDLIIRDNATGGPVAGVEETLAVDLIAPNGEEMTMPIEPQHGADGRYAFEKDYFLTLAGQYKVRLTGTVNGTDVGGEYLLPGPREEMKDRGFPAPAAKDLNELAEENAQLRADLDALRQRVDGGMADGDPQGSNGTPGIALPFVLVAALGVGLLLRRRA